jgi:hypothetical protein
MFLLIAVGLIVGAIGVTFLGSLLNASVTVSAGPGAFGPAPGPGMPVASPASAGLALVIMISQWVLLLGAFGLKVAAYVLFLSVPARAIGARNLVVTMLSLAGLEVLSVAAILVIGLFLGVGVTALSTTPQMVLSVGVGMAITGVVLVLALIGETVVSLLFLKTVSRALKAYGLAMSWNYQTILFGVMAGLFVLGIGIITLAGVGIATTAGPGGPSTGAVSAFGGMIVLTCGLYCIEGFMFLGWLVWYVISLIQLYGVLGRKVGRV